VGVMREIIANGASIILTSYRPEVIAVEDPYIKDFIDNYVSLYIAGYGLEPMAKFGAINDRLWLVNVDALGEEVYKRAMRMLG